MAGFGVRWVSLVFWTWREDAAKTEREVPLPFKTGEYLSKIIHLQKESSETDGWLKSYADLAPCQKRRPDPRLRPPRCGWV